MNIYMNKSSHELTLFQNKGKSAYFPLEKLDGASNGDVIVIIEDDRFRDNIRLASRTNLPVVAIVDEEQEFARQSIHPDAVIFYRDGQVMSSSKTFAQGEGITVSILEDIVKYAVENNLTPEIFVWKPSKKKPEPVVATFRKTEEVPIPAEKAPTPTEKPEKKSKTKEYLPAQKTLEEYLAPAEGVIAVFKGTPQADYLIVAKELARKLQTVFLNISPNAEPTQEFHSAVSNGETVVFNTAFSPGKYIVAAVDLEAASAIDAVYAKASAGGKLVHVVHSPEENLDAIKDWIANYKLDAVIPDNSEAVSQFRQYFEVACGIDEFIASL